MDSTRCSSHESGRGVGTYSAGSNVQANETNVRYSSVILTTSKPATAAAAEGLASCGELLRRAADTLADPTETMAEQIMAEAQRSMEYLQQLQKQDTREQQLNEELSGLRDASETLKRDIERMKKHVGLKLFLPNTNKT